MQGARGRPLGRDTESLGNKEFATRLQRLRDAGVLHGTSAGVLYAVCSSEYWLKIIDKLEQEEDWKTIATIMQFHQQMHEGRPAQRITVTSIGITFSAEEIAKTRAVIRELVPIAVSETPLGPDAPPERLLTDGK